MTEIEQVDNYVPRSRREQPDEQPEKKEYRRKYFRLQVKPKDGEKKAQVGQAAISMPVIVTKIVARPGPKEPRQYTPRDMFGNVLPHHELWITDAETGEEMKVSLESYAKKVYKDDKQVFTEANLPVYGDVKRNFHGGILYAAGQKISVDELAEIVENEKDREDMFEWDPYDWDFEAIGGCYKLKSNWYGKVIRMVRTVISTTRGSMQVFEYEPCDKADFPMYDEIMARYDPLTGCYVDDQPAEGTNTQGDRESPSTGSSDSLREDLIEEARAILETGVPKADAIAELKGIAEVATGAATRAVVEAMKRIENELNDDDPSGDPVDAFMTNNAVDEATFNAMNEAYGAGITKAISLAKLLRDDFGMDHERSRGVAKAFVKFMKEQSE